MSSVYIRLAVTPAMARACRATGAAPRAPLLERLLARADSCVESPDWRVEAMHVLGLNSLAPTAGVVQRARLGQVTEPWAMLATPVHLSAGSSSVHMPLDGILHVDLEELRALAASFEGAFAGSGVRLAAVAGTAVLAPQLLCLSDVPFAAVMRDPHEALGSDVWDFQPQGKAGARLRGLMSEIELWLFAHELTARRAATRQLPATGLWMWAAGATLAELPAIPEDAFTGGDDPILGAVAAVAQWPERFGAGAIVLDATPGGPQWFLAESRWLEPAVEHLRRGGLEELRLSLGARCFSVRAGSYRRFWRRARAWWEYVEHE